MGTTPIYSFPFPDADDAPDGPYSFEQLALAVEGSLVSTWTAFTPGLTATTTNPSAPSAAMGRYSVRGKAATFHIQVTLTATAGSGFYVISLPFTMASIGFDQTCLAGFYDLSGARHYVGRGLLNPGSATIARTHFEAGAVLSSTAPVVPAAGDILYYSGTVEIA